MEKPKQDCKHIRLDGIAVLRPAIGVVLNVERKARSRFAGSGVSNQVRIIGWRRFVHVETGRIISNPGSIEGKKRCQAHYPEQGTQSTTCIVFHQDKTE